MRLIDLNKLKFIEKRKNEIQVIHADWELNIAEKPYKEAVDVIEALCKEIVSKIEQKEVYFEIIINDKTFLSNERHGFAMLIGNLLVKMLVKNEVREREPRLNIPKHLDKTYCISRINMLETINNETIVDSFGGRININGKNFYLLGS